MIRRRWLLLAALSATAAYALPWRRIQHLPFDRWFASGSGLGAAFDASLLGIRGNHELAQTWLASQAPAPALPTLLDRLAPLLHGLDSAAALERRLQRAVERDFAEQRTCEVDGWLLSQTECDLLVLRWMLYGDAAAPGEAEPAIEEAAAPVEALIVEVKNWGPQSTEAGSKFNVQPDGHSGIWIAATGVPPWITVRIDGRNAPTFVSDAAITTGLHGAEQDRILALPGRYPIQLFDSARNVVQTIGQLEVRPRAERLLRADGTRSSVFCPIEGWGPQSTRRGVAENPQPDGSMGVWMQTACLPRRVEFLFGEDALPVVHGENGATAGVPLAMLQVAGVIPLALRDRDSEELLEVGTLTITAND